MYTGKRKAFDFCLFPLDGSPASSVLACDHKTFPWQTLSAFANANTVIDQWKLKWVLSSFHLCKESFWLQVLRVKRVKASLELMRNSDFRMTRSWESFLCSPPLSGELHVNHSKRNGCVSEQSGNEVHTFWTWISLMRKSFQNCPVYHGSYSYFRNNLWKLYMAFLGNDERQKLFRRNQADLLGWSSIQNSFVSVIDAIQVRGKKCVFGWKRKKKKKKEEKRAASYFLGTVTP